MRSVRRLIDNETLTRTLVSVGAVGVVFAIAIVGARLTDRATAAGGARVPVLAELFTSEGCSSCPPADELMRRMVAEQPVDGVEIIGLGEHVDYWDGLGWRDRFAARAFTDRQQRYAERLGGRRGIYTPQLVVDGRFDVVANDWSTVRRTLLQAARAPRAAVTVAGSFTGERELSVRMQIDIDRADRDIPRGPLQAIAAVVEDDLVTDVQGGENASRQLRHAAVVRILEPVGRVAGGSAEITHRFVLDPSWRRDRLRVAAFVQASSTLGVVGAAAVVPESSPSPRTSPSSRAPD